MSFVDLISWLGTTGSLTIVASVLLSLIKLALPNVKDRVAFILSVAFAAIISAASIAIKPYLVALPAWVETVWPIIVWLAGKLWYELTKPAA